MNFPRSLVIEFLGSLLLCLALPLGQSYVAGAALYIVLAYALGGQYNPILTAAGYLGGQITREEGQRRLLAQGAGAFAATVLGLIWYGDKFGPWGSGSFADFLRILAKEVFGAFLVGVVYLRVSAAVSEQVRNLTAVLVGVAMFAAMTIFGGTNPAASLTGALLGRWPWWTILTSLVGGAAGVFGAAYFVNWVQQPDPPAAPPAAAVKPESPPETKS